MITVPLFLWESSHTFTWWLNTVTKAGENTIWQNCTKKKKATFFLKKT